MKELGKALAALRKDRHLRLVDVSKKSGIDEATLSRIENGKMVGTLESHIKIAAALDCDVIDFYARALRKNTRSTDSTSATRKRKVVLKKLREIEMQIKELIRELE